MTDDSKSIMVLDLQLSDQEMLLIGMIVAHWGSLEHEVFTQTLQSFDPLELAGGLPKAMNNIQFTQVLALWQVRVISKCKGKRLSALQEVHDALVLLKEPRDALIHGMWLWSPNNMDRMSTVRVKKREVITTHFDSGYLQDFAFRLAKLNFMIRYPRGAADLATSRQHEGFYISRRGLQMMSELAESKTSSGTSADG